MKRFTLLSAGLLFCAGCTTSGNREPAAARTTNIKGFQIPLHSLENVPPTEAQSFVDVDGIFTELFRREYSNPNPARPNNNGVPLVGTRRGVHPKAHGCVKGEMDIRRDLWSQDRVGIFQPGAHYDIVMRFSNAGPRAMNNDATPDSRGLGFKVLNVKGPHILGSNFLRPGETMSQDFTMNTTDTFFADDAIRYSRFMRTAVFDTTDFAAAANMYLKREFNGILGIGAQALKEFTTGNGVGWRIASTFLKIRDFKMTNPLGAEYNSISAFSHGLGPNAPTVRYEMSPCSGTWSEPVNAANPNFLRENLQKYLRGRDACFAFRIQRNPEMRFSVEDMTIPWDPAIAPYEEVARITIKKQALMDDLECEKLVIQPWNALPEHKPLGGVNRMRLASYLFSIESRRRTNKY